MGEREKVYRVSPFFLPPFVRSMQFRPLARSFVRRSLARTRSLALAHTPSECIFVRFPTRHENVLLFLSPSPSHSFPCSPTVARRAVFVSVYRACTLPQFFVLSVSFSVSPSPAGVRFSVLFDVAYRSAISRRFSSNGANCFTGRRGDGAIVPYCGA